MKRFFIIVISLLLPLAAHSAEEEELLGVLQSDHSLQEKDAACARLKALPADGKDGEAIQAEVYEAGKAAGFEPLRAWFQALYEVLLGQSQGPRFGSFAAIFGLANTIGLIETALSSPPPQGQGYRM